MGCGNSCLQVHTQIQDIGPPPPPPSLKKRWRKQITQSGGEFEGSITTFKTFEEWKECFEPSKKKESVEKVENSEEELARERQEAENRKAKARKLLSTLLDKVSKKITDKILVLVLTFVAKLLEGAEKIADEKHNDSELAGLANALGALVYTFRFKHKGKHKFDYIRKHFVAPQLMKRIQAIVDKTDAKAEEVSQIVGDKLAGLLRGEDAIARAVATVSKMPLVAALEHKVKTSLPEDKTVSEEEIDSKMNSVLFMVSAKLNAATAGHGQISDYASLVIGLLLAGIQQTMRGSGILEKLCSEVNKALKAAMIAAEVATTAKAVAGNVKSNVRGGDPSALCKDSELRYKELRALIQAKVDEAMNVVKMALLNAEGDEEE